MPAHCDTLVRKIMEDIKISNKKFKAGNIASCLSKQKDISQIPLAQRKLQKHERDSNIFGQEIENLLKKGALSQLQIMNEGTFPQSL